MRRSLAVLAFALLCTVAPGLDAVCPSHDLADDSELCPLRDEGEGEGEGEPERVDGSGAPGPLGRALRHLVPLTAVAVVVASALPASRRRIGERRLTAVLVVCALVAVGSYYTVGRDTSTGFVNGWEYFHYYLGSKYAPELGYTGLYEAALVADDETGRKFCHERDAIRDLRTGGCIPVDVVLQDREAVIARFSPERWEEFKDDIGYFKASLSQSRWNGVFRDKGYNATPVWTMFVSPLTSNVSTSSPAGMFALSLIDPLLLLIAFVAVWRSFGIRTALLMVVLIGTHMAMSHSHMKGSLMRTDWIVTLTLAVCAVKAKRPGLGGALMALAAASRIFPAGFAFGLLALPLLASFGPGPRRRTQLRFAFGLGGTFVGLLLLSALFNAPGTWQGFVDKIWLHHDSFSPWRVGFKQLFLGAYDYRPAGFGTHQEVFHDRWALWWGIQLSVLAAVAFISRRLKSWEVLAFGFVPVFFLVAPTYYYYMMLVVPLLFFCGRLHRFESTVGIIWLLGSSSIAYAVESAVGRELPLFYVLSLIVLVVCGLMGASAWRESAFSLANLPPLTIGKRLYTRDV